MIWGLRRATLSGMAPADADPAQVSDTFTTVCNTCGETTQYVKGQVEPHRCRIDLDAQTGRTDA